LAVDDVKMQAPASARADIIDFYDRLIGLEHLGGHGDESCMAFRGYPRSGPRIIVQLTDDPILTWPQRKVLIQLACLAEFVELLREQGRHFRWYRGWGYYDRRLSTSDPAGHLIDFVSYHRF